MRWLWFNWAYSNLDRLGIPTATLRYEDFASDPATSLDHIFAFAGVDAMAETLLTEPLFLSEGHSVSGNPRRLDRRPVEISPDEAWRSSLDPKMQALVGRITRPMLGRYQYPKKTPATRK